MPILWTGRPEAEGRWSLLPPAPSPQPVAGQLTFSRRRRAWGGFKLNYFFPVFTESRSWLEGASSRLDLWALLPGMTAPDPEWRLRAGAAAETWVQDMRLVQETSEWKRASCVCMDSVPPDHPEGLEAVYVSFTQTRSTMYLKHVPGAVSQKRI